jgi:hypothetical protein
MRLFLLEILFMVSMQQSDHAVDAAHSILALCFLAWLRQREAGALLASRAAMLSHLKCNELHSLFPRNCACQRAFCEAGALLASRAAMLSHLKCNELHSFFSRNCACQRAFCIA